MKGDTYLYKAKLSLALVDNDRLSQNKTLTTIPPVSL